MDRPLLGIALFVASSMFFSMSDTAAKYLTGSVPPVEIAWVRYIVFVLLAASPLVRKGRAGLHTRRPVLQILRGLGVVGSAVFFIASLASLPVAEATTVNFISPLLILAFSGPFLGERVGLGGWLAVLAGFAGVLVVVRPGSAGFHPAALLVLLSSVCWVSALLITRRMAATERPSVTLFWTAATGLAVLTLLLPFVFTPMPLASLGLALFIGVVSTAGQLLTVLAYRYAAAPILAPLSYGQLIWATLFGFLVFGALPDQWTMIGAAIIACSGVYAVQSARSQHRQEMILRNAPRGAGA